jgi:Transglycosylase-like domain
MQQKPQRRFTPLVTLLLVGLMIPSLMLAAARLPDSPRSENLASASRVLLEGNRPAEAEHEAGLMELLARMLDRRLARRLIRARERAREAAYIRSLNAQISWRADWDAIAMCESTQRWHLNVGIFDGGLQFLPSTWNAYGGQQFARFAWQASKLEQMVVASRTLSVEGPSAWPHCFRWA